MAVNARTDILLTIVEMDGFKVLGANYTIKLIESHVVAHFRTKIVACGKGMTSIDTYAHTGLIVHSADNSSDLSKSMTQVCPLPCRVFDYGCHTFGFTKGKIDFLRNLVKALLFTNFLEVATWMKIEQWKTKLLTTRHLVEKSSPRLLKIFLIGTAQIN